MPYRIGKTFSFAAAHHLPSLPPEHKCHRPHGHNYTVTIELEGTQVDAGGFILDYAELAPFGDYIQATLDHQDLNEVLPFEPTAELLAAHLFERAVGIGFGQLIKSVRVCETPNTFAEWVAW